MFDDDNDDDDDDYICMGNGEVIWRGKDAVWNSRTRHDNDG